MKKAEEQDDNRTWGEESGINEERKRKYLPRHGSQTHSVLITLKWDKLSLEMVLKAKGGPAMD